jgi:predicted small metal-binding protein
MDQPTQKRFHVFVCYPLTDCGFTVKSHDENEVIDAYLHHAEKVHGQRASKAMAKGMIKVE